MKDTVSVGVALPVSLHRARAWFAIDAAVTGVNGLAYVAVSNGLESILGVPAPVLRTIGWGLMLFALVVAWHARSSPSRPNIGRLIIGTNSLWVVASILVASMGALDLSTIGRVWVLLQGFVVAGLTVAQFATSQRGTSPR